MLAMRANWLESFQILLFMPPISLQEYRSVYLFWFSE